MSGLNRCYVGSTLINGADAFGWVRPFDWLLMPTVADTEQKFVGLHAVFPNASNFVALSAAGAYTVDWGDGTTENIASGIQANHIYDYSTIPTATTSYRGYRQVLVTVTPQAGANLTTLNLHKKHSTNLLQEYTTGWLDIVISGPNLTTLTMSASTMVVQHTQLERAQLISTNNISSHSYMFNYCSRLQSVPVWKMRTSAGVLADYMFRYCRSLRIAPTLDTSAVTSGIGMFLVCDSLMSVPTYDMRSMTNGSSMFANCYSLREVPAIDFSGMTSGGFASAFNSCPSMNRFLPTTMNVSFSVAYGQLSGTALNEIYTNLPTVAGQTITVTSNYGTATDNPSIATAKGWTVTG